MTRTSPSIPHGLDQASPWHESNQWQSRGLMAKILRWFRSASHRAQVQLGFAYTIRPSSGYRCTDGDGTSVSLLDGIARTEVGSGLRGFPTSMHIFRRDARVAGAVLQPLSTENTRSPPLYYFATLSFAAYLTSPPSYVLSRCRTDWGFPVYLCLVRCCRSCIRTRST